MTALHETEVDGVRCFWVNTGRPTLAARLVFRFGSADEEIYESGWQHLIEHSVLEEASQNSKLDVNGHVSLLETAFDSHGDPSTVSAHLGALTAQLVRPRFDRIEHEIGVLRAEAKVRGSTASGRALSWRYGARGPGLVSYGEPGLGRATSDGLAVRASRVFTRGNAALALDGPPPVGLRLHLGEGGLFGLRPAVQVDEPPAAYVESSGVVASGLTRRSGTGFVGTEVIRAMLVEQLRHRSGAAYAPWATYERLDAENAIVLAGSDAQSDTFALAQDVILNVLDELATTGPGQNMLDHAIERMTRAMRDPYSLMASAVGAAVRHLHGLQPETTGQLIERAESVTVEQVRDDLRAVRDSLLVGAPAQSVEDSGLRVLAFEASPRSRGGSRYRATNWPADGSQLRVTNSRVEVSSGREARGMAFDEIVGWYVYSDGLRIAIREDGFNLAIHAGEWQRGTTAVASLDAVIPAHLHLPHPSSEIPPAGRQRWLHRWRHGARRKLLNFRVFGFGLLLLLLVAGTAGWQSYYEQGDRTGQLVVIGATLFAAVAPIQMIVKPDSWMERRGDRKRPRS